jgi:serine/threonine-protein phosphatase 6 regulatory ankyrin repeat subunit B
MSSHSILLLLGMLCAILPKATTAQPPAPPATPYDTALFTAIRSGDRYSLQKQLDAGSDANAIQNGFSALMIATLAGTPQQMQLLIDRGAKPNYADHDSLTALFLAIPDQEKSLLLVQHGADPNQLSKAHYSPLIKLVNFPNTTGLFLTLVSKGADPKRAARDNALLYWAAGTDDTTLVGLLLRLGFRAGDSTLFGDYPINQALAFRCSHTLKMLVDHGANVNVALPPIFLPNSVGLSALMQAALADDEDSFFYLLDHGADVNAKSKTGYTALMCLQLAETDHPSLTKALLAHGARITEKTPAGDDAIGLASKKGNTQSLQILKQH